MAWLARNDGSVVIGHGPMAAAREAPEEGVAFHLRPYGQPGAEPWRIPAEYEVIDVAELSHRLPAGMPPQFDWQPVDTVAFSEVFQEIMISIRQGRFEKTVPVVTEVGHSKNFQALDLMGSMASCRSPLHSYGYKNGDQGFAGATPELLLSMNGSELRTMALAGTARSEDRDIFAVDEKEIREHEYVAQTLEAKLLDLGILERGEREILDLGPIVHFLTPIRVELSQPVAPAELLKRLHPTPALGPLPRTATTMKQLIDWRERLDCPAGFGAPYGVWENGRFEAVVAIRGVWWEDNTLKLPAGCGVIEASRMVNEWRELRLKREAVKRVLRCL
ncbi:MAG: chorismate-binding protein [Akkermansiaceae bacterium]|nr:chorismate-binding protein [Akkermansiaceae bacterium]